MPKKIFPIPCTWEVYGVIEVEAETQEEAVRYAIEEAALPTDGDYLSDSFKIDYDSDLYGTIIEDSFELD